MATQLLLKGNMFYTVYKITNLINKKFYIGKHKTNDLNDEYMGSGKLIKRAIKKYGKDNFIKELLFMFDTEQEMNEKEKELVLISEETYNLCEGGNGGFSYINSNVELIQLRDSYENKLAGRKAADKKLYETKGNQWRIDASKKAAETRKKLGIVDTFGGKQNYKNRLGKKNNPETNEKIRLAALERERKKRE